MKNGKQIFVMSLIIVLVCIAFERISNAAEPYVIGFQTDVTGPGSSNLAPQGEGFRAYIEALNDRGGINGHPVKVIYEDDKSSPPRAGAIATKFILEDKVLAIAGLSFSHAQVPVYELGKKYGVPVVVPFACTAEVFAPVEYNCREIFATGPIMSPKFHWHGYAEALAISKLLPKGSAVVPMSYATPGGRTQTSWGARWCEMFGYKVPFQDDIPPGTVDVSVWAEKVVKANPDIVIASFGGELTVPFWIALDKMGWTKPILISNFLNTDDFLKADEALIKPKHNIYLFTEMAMPFDVNPVLEYKEMDKALKKYGHRYTLSARHASGWLTAQVIEAALAKVGWPCSRSALIDALEKTDLYTKGLTGGAIRFSPNDHYGTTWVRIYQWDPTKKKLIVNIDWVKMEPKEIAKQYAKQYK